MKTWLDAILDPDSHERFISCPGQEVEDSYAVHFDKNGVRVLMKDGKKNTFDDIQSHRESCDINIILKKYMNGDFTVLNRADPQYLDTTEFPHSYAESFEKHAAVVRYFNSLDPETRAKYNHSVEQFLCAEIDAKYSDMPQEVTDES